MSSSDIPDKFRELIEKIVVENGLTVANIKYETGSEDGAGYMSNTAMIDVNGDDKSLHLFCKSNTMTTWSGSLPADKMFMNEIYFYNTVYPAYQAFLKEKGVEDGFRNVPKCYRADRDVIVLENLKRKGYDLFKRRNIMNDEHILFTMRTLSKFHALSFAFKDQRKDLYNIFVRKIQSCFTEMMLQEGFVKTLKAEMILFLRRMDPVEDKYLLDASGDLVKTLIESIVNVENYSCSNPVIIQGDCWCNNVMYLYEEGNQTRPIDMMLVDWQVLRNGSPAFDLIYFFYFIASEAALENMEHYISVYYDELSKNMKRLGSDPNVLYPFAALKEEWKKFAKYAFAQGFFVIKALVADDDEQAYFYEYSEISDKITNAEEGLEQLMPKIRNEQLFFSRMKVMLKHFIEHEFL